MIIRSKYQFHKLFVTQFVGSSVILIMLVFISACDNKKENDFPTSRDPLKWPFSSTSIWNMPIGDSAVYVHARLEPVDAEGLSVDEDIIVLTPWAPMMDVYLNHASWTKEHNRCYPEGGILYSVPCPDDFIYSYDNWEQMTPNAGIASLMPDGRTIVQSQPFSRCEPGMPATSKWLFPDQDIYGDGMLGAHGGSGMSALGGAIRLGEAMPGSGPIRHALKINIYAAENILYDSIDKGFRWPAVVADGYAPLLYGKKRTTPFVKGVLMGSLLALPSWMCLDSMNFETEPGRIFAQAFQDYGAYVVDDTYRDSWAIISAWEPEGRWVDQFEEAWGFIFITVDDDSPWARDMEKIYFNLHLVANNGPESVGGGGKPRQPLAPEITPSSKSANAN